MAGSAAGIAEGRAAGAGAVVGPGVFLTAAGDASEVSSAHLMTLLSTGVEVAIGCRSLLGGSGTADCGLEWVLFLGSMSSELDVRALN
jgi:hypothetical protein